MVQSTHVTKMKQFSVWINNIKVKTQWTHKVFFYINSHINNFIATTVVGLFVFRLKHPDYNQVSPMDPILAKSGKPLENDNQKVFLHWEFNDIYDYLWAASFCSSETLSSVSPVMGLITRITDAHMPGPAFGAPKVISDRSSFRKAAAISAASCCSSSCWAASTISWIKTKTKINKKNP